MGLAPSWFRTRLGAVALLFLLLGAGMGRAEACFGTRLRIGVPREAQSALAAYAAGYYIEEKTGIEPEFVEGADAGAQVAAPDLRLVGSGQAVPAGVVVRPAGEIPGLGAAKFWIRSDVLEDLRFTTVDRTLVKLPAFFSSRAFLDALQSSAPPKKAARKAVLDAK